MAPESGQTTNDTAPRSAATTAAEPDTARDTDGAPAAGRAGGAIPLGSGAPAATPQPAGAPVTAPQPAFVASAGAAGTAEATAARPVLGNACAPVTLPPRMSTGAAAASSMGGDDPLIAEADRLRATWLRLQAAFVDDPHASVADAADLVEHATQTLIGALRQRQKRLRDAWEHTPGGSDTEQLRLIMQRYRALFNQICRP